MAIEYLKRQPRKDRKGVAFIYCDYRDRNIQTINNLTSSLILQPMQDTDSFPPSVWKFRQQCRSRHRDPTLEEKLALLKEVTQRLSKIFIIVDALDEYSEADEQDDDHGYPFLEALQEISHNVHLMVTARPFAFLKKTFQGAFCTEISASIDDLRLYAQSRMRIGTRFGDRVRKDTSLHHDVLSAVCARGCRMSVSSRLSDCYLARD